MLTKALQSMRPPLADILPWLISIEPEEGGIVSLAFPNHKIHCWRVLLGICSEPSLPRWGRRTAVSTYAYTHLYIILDSIFRLWSRMKTESSYSTKPAPTGQDSSPNPKQGSPKLAFIEFWPQCLNQDNVSFEESNFERFEWVQSVTFAGHSLTWLIHVGYHIIFWTDNSQFIVLILSYLSKRLGGVGPGPTTCPPTHEQTTETTENITFPQTA